MQDEEASLEPSQTDEGLDEIYLWTVFPPFMLKNQALYEFENVHRRTYKQQ